MNIEDKKKQILLIEDDRGFADLMRRWISINTNWEVGLAYSGEQGTCEASSGDWDLVISDVNLPNQSGFDLVKYCKKNIPRVPVLLITAQESMEYALEALRTKADDLLLKPFTSGDIVAKAASLMEQARAVKKANQKRVLAIGAHPDDVEIGCGGILARHQQDGDEISILTLSNGEIGGDTRSRMDEAENAARRLDARLFWGGLVDTKITEGRETITIIENCIRSVDPHIVYTHTSHDRHQDHRNTHLASLVACRGIESIFCYQSPSSTIEFRPTVFSDITEFLDAKLDLIQFYRTQTEKCDYLSSDLIASTARYWGRYAGNSIVEPLEVIRDSK